MAEERDLLFKAEDPRGYSITLSSDQYYNHIVSSVDHNAHTEFTPEEIRKCIEEPQVIVESKSVPSRDLYFGRTSAAFPQLFLRTAVEIDDDMKTGEVVTAHLSKSLSGGKDGGIKYVSYRSKL